MARASASGSRALRAVCGWVLLLGLGAPTAAVAGSSRTLAPSASRIDLQWSAPSSCPTAEAVRAQVKEALDDAVGPDASADGLSIDAQVSATSEGFDAELELRGPWGASSRSLHSPTCETLVEAVVLLAVVSVTEAPPDAMVVPEPEPVEVPDSPPSDDGGQVSSEADDPVESEPEPEPFEPESVEPEPEPFEPDPDEDATSGRTSSADASERARVGVLVRPELNAGGGILPGGDFGGAIAAGLFVPRAQIELVLGGWIPQTQAVEPGVDIRLDLLVAEFRGCAVVSALSWLRVLPCGGLEVGAMRGQGQGSGLAPGRTSWQAWVAFAGTPALSFLLRPRVALYLGGSVVIPLLRAGFALEGEASDAYRAPVVAGRGRLGIEIRLR